MTKEECNKIKWRFQDAPNRKPTLVKASTPKEYGMMLSRKKNNPKK